MSATPVLPTPPSRALRAVGPWMRDAEGRKVMLRGITYGPFKPDAEGRPWPDNERLCADLAHIRALGFDTVRIYESPTDAVLQACEDHGLRLICGIAWTQHVDFFADATVRADALRRTKAEALRLGQHPCVVALIVGNEIEKTLVRWMGPERVRGFIEALIAEAKTAAPSLLVGYASYPSTEYLTARNADFNAFNVFLESRAAFARYVHHLQNLAPGRPLLISEFGLDAKSHGTAAQAETFCWWREVCAAANVAGSFWFSYTDEWHRGGAEVTEWEFGIVDRSRNEKPVCAAVPGSAMPAASATPKRVSVLVCTRNGAATLRGCLEALSKQSHPDHEVIVIDDGSSDETPDIAKQFPQVRYERQEHAGLSAARNFGMHLATGDLLAYTDDDCMPDEEWLTQVCLAFDDEACVAAGGPNLPPPPRNVTETCVAVAPGAPSHVLLDDFEAEHLPGCNLVIRKTALRAIGGFREEFTSAGDDVDVCWRLQAHGGRLRFMPSAVVWHHRRRTVRAYLRQQRGYGHAEAMLIRRYPHRFAWLGGARWRGTIYGDAPANLLHTGAVIRFGRFGNALFQSVYTQNAPSIWDWMTGLPWLAASALLFPFSVVWSNAWLVGCSMLLMMAAAAWRRTRVLPETGTGVKPAHLPLLWMLCLLQPVIRDWGRLSGMVMLRAKPQGRIHVPWPSGRPAPLRHPQRHWATASFWNEEGVTRDDFLPALRHLSAPHGFDWQEPQPESAIDAVLVSENGTHFGVQTVTEHHGGGRTLTRLRFGPHRTWRDEAVLSAFPLLWLAALLAGWPGDVRLLIVVGGLAWIGWGHLRRRSLMDRLRGLLLRAAVEAGLCPRGALPPLREQELASAVQSAEM